MNCIHNPNVEKTDTIVFDFDNSEQRSVCNNCNSDIYRFSYYDSDRGRVISKWTIVK